MKKEIKIALKVIAIILLIYIVIVVFTNNFYSYSKKVRSGDYEYVYKYTKLTVTVNKYAVMEWQCIKAPCPESSRHLVMIYTLPLTNKYKDIDNKTDLYEILEREENSGVKEQGYVYNKKDNTVSIYLGEKNTGGYWIKIDSVEINEANTAIIAISEVSPAEGEDVTMALTTPMVKIKLKKKVDDVFITGLDEPIEELSDTSE